MVSSPDDHGKCKQINHISWDQLDKRKYYVFGPTFMVGVRLLVFPPTLIKTRLQVQSQKSMYNGTLDAFKKIFKAEGIRGFYKGFATSNLTLISGQIYITTLEVVRSKLPNINESTKSLIAGLSASLSAQTITVPVDIISQKQMMQRKSVLSSVARVENSHKAWSVMKSIYKNYGVKGFYKGYLASLLTYAPSSGIWWASYYYFTQFYGDNLPETIPVLLVQAISGPSASVVSAILTNPADTIRTRLQVLGGNKSILSVARDLYKEEGIRALNKGLTARLASSIPASMIIVLSYESVKKLSLKDEFR